jgi:hypothetical protein
MKKLFLFFSVLLVVFLAIIFINFGESIKNKKAQINCEQACHPLGDNWTFLGNAKNNVLSSKEDCITACQNKIK